MRSSGSCWTGASASHTSVGAERPRRFSGSCAAERISVWAAAWVAASMRTPPGGAAACSRNAVLTTSPARMAWPPSWAAATSTSASPVAMPTRNASPLPSVSRASARCTSSPARTHRTASVSVATGAPNSTITASPTYFSTTPPYWRTIRRTVAKKPLCRTRTVSGSARSANGVEPTASTNSTLIRRRSSCRWAGAGSVRDSADEGPRATRRRSRCRTSDRAHGHDRSGGRPATPRPRSGRRTGRPARRVGHSWGKPGWRSDPPRSTAVPVMVTCRRHPPEDVSGRSCRPGGAARAGR